MKLQSQVPCWIVVMGAIKLKYGIVFWKPQAVIKMKAVTWVLNNAGPQVVLGNAVFSKK